MQNKELSRLKKKKYYLINKLKNTEDFIRGSITIIKRKCGNKKCRCQSGGEKHPGIYFSVTLNKKTKLIYLGNKKIDRAKYLLKNHEVLKKLLDDIVFINLEILKLESF